MFSSKSSQISVRSPFYHVDEEKSKIRKARDDLFQTLDGNHCLACGKLLQHHLSRGNGKKKENCDFNCISTKVKLGKKLKTLVMGNQNFVDQNMYLVQYVYRRLDEGILPMHLYDLVFRLHGIGLLRKEILVEEKCNGSIT